MIAKLLALALGLGGIVGTVAPADLSQRVDQAEHPIVTTDSHLSTTSNRIDFTCVTLTLDVQELSRARGLTGRLSAENSCDFGVALLLSPVETRVRGPNDKRFVNEHMIHAAYARLYVISSRTDFLDAFSEMDGGLIVHGLPDYVVIPAHSTCEIVVHGENAKLSQMQDGKYLVFVESIIAALPGATAKSGGPSMDLGNQVTARSTSERRVFIRSEAEWISSSGPIVAVTD